MEERRVALLFGNKAYENEDFAPLQSPHADVDALAAVLKDPERGGFHDVKVFKDANRLDILRNLTKSLRKKNRDDLLLVYFSGHGQTDDHGDLYLASVEAEKELLTATAVDARHVAQEIGRADKGKTVLVLDCCHAGAFPSHFKSGDGLQAKADAYADGAGCYVLMACDEFELAHDGRGESLSLLTHHIVEGLQGAADTDQDGFITVNELSDYLDRALRKGGKQRFTQSGHNQRGSVLLGRSGIEPLKLTLAKAEEQVFAWRRSDAITLERANEVLGFLAEKPDPKVAETAPRFELIQRAADGTVGSGEFLELWRDSAPVVVAPEPEPEPDPEPEPTAEPEPAPEAVLEEPAPEPTVEPEPAPAQKPKPATRKPATRTRKTATPKAASAAKATGTKDADKGADTSAKPEPAAKKQRASSKKRKPHRQVPPQTCSSN
ncbi:caspase family protein [Tateyamaria armeniaca]|uniref:Caspase family protein n=1 Tax=Tateyamaria armeniaca TaxID=2518930 RepID=A0ABW8UYZ8_9RHOB